jgi:hypothetical protein
MITFFAVWLAMFFIVMVAFQFLLRHNSDL